MYRNALRSISIGPALLVSFSLALPAFANLREEAITYREQGYEAQRRGDQANALAYYQKAAALDPAYPAPFNDIGVLLEEQGRLEDAERAYQQALTLNPSYLEPHANLAMLYERMGQKEKAIYYWLKRYELGDPYDPWTSRAEERLVALGVLKYHPGAKGSLFSRKHAIEEQLREHARSIEEFHAVTDEDGPWP
ncbi:MAG: tetratricopeptide repeat protein [Candidatus Omnitrophica bacterium]|nr:tetratricopeptide repeat protein [Candidatus Omnitrophota bacterium]